MRHIRSGFSLFELLIVMAIVLIAVTLTAPRLLEFFTNTQEKIVLAKLLNTIHMTRTEAMTRHETITFCSGNPKHYCAEEWSFSWVVVMQNQILHAIDIPRASGKLFFRAFPKGRHTIEFSSMGFSKAANATFWFCRVQHPSPQWAIMINKVGRARVVYPDEHNQIEDGQGNLLSC